MNIKNLLLLVVLNLISFSNILYGQNCFDFQKSENCQAKNADGFKLTSMSQKHYLEVGKTVTYKVVLFGENEIIIKCCTEDEFYPIRFKIKSSENGKIIYDNKYNHYIDNLNLLLDHTEPMSIEISVEPRNKRLKNLKDKKVCIGMAIYMENTFFKN